MNESLAKEYAERGITSFWLTRLSLRVRFYGDHAKEVKRLQNVLTVVVRCWMKLRLSKVYMLSMISI